MSVRGPPTILVVEDDSTVREVFRRAVRSGGYTAVAVSDGFAALHYLETHTPSAIVLDWILPRLHGGGLHRELKATGLTDKVPVILVTGTAETLDATVFFQVLRKPVSPEALLAVIDRALGR